MGKKEKKLLKIGSVLRVAIAVAAVVLFSNSIVYGGWNSKSDPPPTGNPVLPLVIGGREQNKQSPGTYTFNTGKNTLFGLIVFGSEEDNGGVLISGARRKPLAKLDVEGDVRIRDGVIIPNDLFVFEGTVLRKGAGNSMSWQNPASWITLAGKPVKNKNNCKGSIPPQCNKIPAPDNLVYKQYRQVCVTGNDGANNYSIRLRICHQ